MCSVERIRENLPKSWRRQHEVNENCSKIRNNRSNWNLLAFSSHTNFIFSIRFSTTMVFTIWGQIFVSFTSSFRNFIVNFYSFFFFNLLSVNCSLRIVGSAILDYYSQWIMQFLAGFNYLIIFGIVLSMEISLCRFISTCATDLKQIFSEINDKKVDEPEQTKVILRETIKLHQQMLM